MTESFSHYQLSACKSKNSQFKNKIVIHFFNDLLILIKKNISNSEWSLIIY